MYDLTNGDEDKFYSVTHFTFYVLRMAKASLETFDGGDFQEWRERLECYFCANDIGVVTTSASAAEKTRVERKMTAHLISHLSKTIYSTLKTLCLPNSPADLKYSVIAAKLEEHYRVKSSRTTATHHFRQCVQKPSESITDYSLRLQRCAVDCKFGAYLDRALCDQFVSGVRVMAVRKVILSKPDDQIKKFEDVFQLALTEETAGEFAQTLEPEGERLHKTSTRPKPSWKEDKSKTQKTCFRCGDSGHLANTCRHKDKRCNYCHKQGHLERVCRSKKDKSCHHLEEEDTTNSIGETASLFKLSYDATSPKHGPLIVTVNVNDVNIDMELDTGSGVTVLTADAFKQVHGDLSSLSKPSVILKGFSGTAIKCLGETTLPVSIAGESKNVLVRVVENDGPSLLGRDLLNIFTLPWKQLFAEQVHRILGTVGLKKEFPNLFDCSTLGKVSHTRVKINVDCSNPVFMKARTVPFSIREKYDEALDKLEADGVIRKVIHSDWASPTVPVLKPDGSLRICADYSCTINKHSKLEQYPLPTIEEMMSKLQGGQRFSKLDLSQAYHQLELHPDSCAFTTINTHRGLYEYVRLPFGINSAVSIFQRTMETILADLPGCVVYVDDILVTGKTDEEHSRNLKAVMQRLEDFGMRLKLEKCSFFQDSVSYLGHTITANGVAPSTAKVADLIAVTAPSTVSELQSFIGSANYLRKFISNFAQLMAPLYALIKRDAAWRWSKCEDDAFNAVKDALGSAQVLTHYSTDRDLILQTDASGYGLGAVLLQPDVNGDIRPVAYASRVLNSAEKNYSQIEREALSLVFGVQKFRQYLLGRRFILRTDHKPLISLFDPKQGVPVLTSSRLKKWRLILSAYDYVIQHVSGKQNVFADYLSRKPTPGTATPEEQVDVQVLLIDEEAVLNADCVAKETKADPTLSQVLKFVHGVWPTEVSPELRPYYNKRFALSVSTGVLILDSRVIVPESLRPLLLRDLHSEHSGIVRMKRLARKYIWWPRLDSDIEETVSSCHICQSQAKCPPKVHGTWTWPSGPWKRLHIDFAGPYLGKMFLVIVDAHSKYLDVVPMTHATTSGVISALRQNFSIFGLPEHIVSDNGSQFTSADFQHFLSQNGIFHTKTAPGHPATNGLAERYVGFFKSKMSALSSDDPPGDLSTRLSRFLFSYRSTPNSTGRSPAELLTGRQPRTRFDLLQPSTLREQVRTFEDNLDHSPRFAPGDPVFALSFSAHTPKWVPAVVTTVISPMNYKVRVDETVWKRHRDQLRPRTIPAAMLPDVQLTGTAKPTEGVSADVPPTDKPTEGVSAVLPPAAQRHPSPPSSTTVSDKVIPSFSPSIDFSMESSTSSRPKRTIRKPGRYDD